MTTLLMPPLVYLEVESDSGVSSTNCLLLDGTIIIASDSNDATLAAIDSVKDCLVGKLNLPLVSICKSTPVEGISDGLDWQQLLDDLKEYLLDYAKHFDGLPMDFEAHGVVFQYEEMCALLPKEFITRIVGG